MRKGKGDTFMCRKQILCLLLAGLLSFSITACGQKEMEQSASVESESNNPSDEEESVENVEEDQQSGSVAEEEAGEEDQQFDEDVAEGILLQRFATTLPWTDLAGMRFSYQKVEMDGYPYYETNGIGDVDYVREGCLYRTILDLDEDGKNELLTINLEKSETGYDFGAAVYEVKKGEVALGAKTTLLSNVLGKNVDGGTIRFLLKDNKYICIDSWQSTFISADGTWVDLDSFSYNGADFVQMTDFSFCGSEMYELGKSSTELVDQLNTMQFVKSAAAVYDRDVFHFCSADEGVKGLLKIQLNNSHVTGETKWGEEPYVQVYQESAEDLYQTDYLLDSHTRLLTAEELKGMSKQSLRLARNEIYARYGWLFEDRQLQNYFDKKIWYTTAEKVDDSVLSEIELANKKLILEAEEQAKDQKLPLKEYYSYLDGVQELVAKELGNISEFLSEIDAYGFTLSFYEDVRDVDLSEVFYAGAGLGTQELTKACQKEYLDITGQEELYTDFGVVDEKSVNQLLEEKTGYGFGDMHKLMTWTYLPEHNAYGREAGDTNYVAPQVIDGISTADGLYYIQYENSAFSYIDEIEDCILVLKKVENGYLFVANKPMR